MRFFCFSLLVFSWFVPGLADARDIRVAGMGIRKCVDWNTWKEGGNGEARAITLEWAQGFIAGHNIYARSGNEAAPSVVADTKVLVTLLDAYCQKNPDERILNGVSEITQNLGGAKVNLAPKVMPPASSPTPMPNNPRPADKAMRES